MTTETVTKRTTGFVTAYRVFGYDADGNLEFEYLVAVENGKRPDELAQLFQTETGLPRSANYYVERLTPPNDVLVARRAA